MSRLWKLTIRADESFASLVRRDKNTYGENCAACGRISKRQHQPQMVQWEEGSDVIPDFVIALGLIIAREAIVDLLFAKFRGWEKHAIKFHEPPLLHRPVRVTKRTKKRVWLPYQGPPLAELFVTHEVALLPRSTVEFEQECSVCGGRRYKAFKAFVGVEARHGLKHEPRRAGKGVRNEWHVVSCNSRLRNGVGERAACV